MQDLRGGWGPTSAEALLSSPLGVSGCSHRRCFHRPLPALMHRRLLLPVMEPTQGMLQNNQRE